MPGNVARPPTEIPKRSNVERVPAAAHQRGCPVGICFEAKLPAMQCDVAQQLRILRLLGHIESQEPRGLDFCDHFLKDKSVAENARAARPDKFALAGGLHGAREADFVQPIIRLSPNPRKGDYMFPYFGTRSGNRDSIGDHAFALPRDFSLNENEQDEQGKHGEPQSVVGPFEQGSTYERASEDRDEQNRGNDEKTNHAFPEEKKSTGQADKDGEKGKEKIHPYALLDRPPKAGSRQPHQRWNKQKIRINRPDQQRCDLIIVGLQRAKEPDIAGRDKPA